MVMYSSHGKASPLEPSQWKSVLKLANLWQFDVIRNVAIKSLQPVVNKMTPQATIVMARRFEVEKWLLDAVEVMAKRPEPIGVEDVEVIGLEDALRVAHVREQAMEVQKALSGGRTWNIDWKERSALNFRPTIMLVFGIEDCE